MIRNSGCFANCSLLLFFFVIGCAKPLTVVSYGGGSYQKALKTTLCDPFSKAHSTKIDLVNWEAAYGQLQQMVASKNVPWDVVEVTAAQFERGKRDQLFQGLDLRLDPDHFQPGSIDQYGVASVYWSTVLAYSKGGSTSSRPTNWNDFWDIKRFPGKRAMYDDPRGNLEFALIADGVPPSEVYRRMDLDRAFRKLDQIKPYILKWWSDGTEPIQLLMTGQVVMTTAWSGRLYSSPDARASIGYSWKGAATDRTYWVVPRGAPHEQLAKEFVGFTTTPSAERDEVALVGYGPANLDALNLLDAPTRALLPTSPENMAASFQVDASWWAEHEQEVDLRWLNWKAK